MTEPRDPRLLSREWPYEGPQGDPREAPAESFCFPARELQGDGQQKGEASSLPLRPLHPATGQPRLLGIETPGISPTILVHYPGL